MTPVFFGTAARRLFGVYHAPTLRRGGTPRAVVVCAPFGQEYLRAHRSLRQLAQQLAAAGVHVLRFDYFGTGDSAGGFEAADLAGWQADIAAAVEELRDMSEAPRVVLAGLRLGATLAAAAAAAAARPREVAGLVLWDPVVNGTAYVAELIAGGTLDEKDGTPASARAAADGGGHEVGGFPMSARLEAEIAALDLPALLAAAPVRTFVLRTGSSAGDAALDAALAGRSPEAEVERLDDRPAWMNHERSGAGAIPVRALQRIAAWVSA